MYIYDKSTAVKQVFLSIRILKENINYYKNTMMCHLNKLEKSCRYSCVVSTLFWRKQIMRLIYAWIWYEGIYSEYYYTSLWDFM